ncbi:hypothetical protein GCM10010320_75510 [Streptomyces caelestis]|nr:hypothetical protein GCM10010320_75510 [Streptomyces caelestis]
MRAAERAGKPGEAARSGLAVAEAHRRLGRVEDADRAWKASHRAGASGRDGVAAAVAVELVHAFSLWRQATIPVPRRS